MSHRQSCNDLHPISHNCTPLTQHSCTQSNDQLNTAKDASTYATPKGYTATHLLDAAAGHHGHAPLGVLDDGGVRALHVPPARTQPAVEERVISQRRRGRELTACVHVLNTLTEKESSAAAGMRVGSVCGVGWRGVGMG